MTETDRKTRELAEQAPVSVLVLTPREAAFLLANSTRDRMVELGFGPGVLTLHDTPGNEWARRVVLEARKQTGGSDRD